MTKWYIWPINEDPLTHQYLITVIGAQHEQKNKICADGKKKNISRNLFRCPAGYENVKTAIIAIPAHGLKFHVYKEEVEGEIVRVKTWESRLRCRTRLY